MTNQVVLVGGGVRSGKSAFALARARQLGSRRAFLATAQAFDGEMTDRIALHRRERGDEFRTLEEPLDLSRALRELHEVDVVVIDCITIWLSNLLLAERTLADTLSAVDDLVTVLSARRFHAVVVTNEVGMGVVPDTPLGRLFRDASGMAHQRLAAAADEIDVAILGCVLRMKPGPVQLHG